MPRQLSVETIRARIRALELQARQLERQAVRRLQSVAAKIAKHDLSFAELKQAFELSKSGTKGHSPAGRSVPVKYRDDEGNSWSGRGRPPLWLVAAEQAGKSRDSFLIGAKKVRAKAEKPKDAKPKKAPRRKSQSKKVEQVETAPGTDHSSS